MIGYCSNGKLLILIAELRFYKRISVFRKRTLKHLGVKGTTPATYSQKVSEKKNKERQTESKCSH